MRTLDDVLADLPQERRDLIAARTADMRWAALQDRRSPVVERRRLDVHNGLTRVVIGNLSSFWGETFVRPRRPKLKGPARRSAGEP